MDYADKIIKEIEDEMRLKKIVDDIIDEGNAHQIKPQILAWYKKNFPK